MRLGGSLLKGKMCNVNSFDYFWMEWKKRNRSIFDGVKSYMSNIRNR